MQPELQADVILNFWFEECSYGPYPEVRSRLKSSGRQTRHTDRSLKEPIKTDINCKTYDLKNSNNNLRTTIHRKSKHLLKNPINLI
jgi:hypothetical protein